MLRTLFVLLYLNYISRGRVTDVLLHYGGAKDSLRRYYGGAYESFECAFMCYRIR